MHDQQHRPPHGEPPDRVHDPGLGLAVQRRRGLVQQQHRPVRQEGPRQRQPLPLPGGQPHAALAQQGLGPARQRGHELPGSGVLQGGGHLTVTGGGPGQPYVLGDGAGEQVRPLRHPRDPLPPVLRRQLGQVHARDPHPPGGRPDEPQQHLEQCGLADAARAGESHALPRCDGQRYGPGRVLVPALEADGDPVDLDPQGGAARQLRRTGRAGAGGFQDLEDLLGGRQPLRGSVVLRSYLPQRQVGLGRQDQDDQARVEVEFAVDQSHADGHGNQRDRQGRQQFQGEGRQEGDAQRPHRRPAVVVGDLADRLGLRLGPAEDLQGGKTGHHVEEVPRQPRQEPPLAVHPGLGGHADEDHEHRNEGEGDHDDGRRDPVLGDDAGEHRHRHHDREPQLGQVAGEVVVERVHAPGGQRHQRSGPLPARTRGPELRGPVQQSAPQFRLDRRTGTVRGQLRQPCDQSAAERHRREQQKRRAERRTVEALLEGTHHDLGDEHRLTDDQPRPGEPQGHHRPQEEAGGPGVPEQARVDRFHVKHPPGEGRPGRRVRWREDAGASTGTGLSARRRCAASRSACGTPSRSSPGRAARAGWPRPHTRS